jgi:transposase
MDIHKNARLTLRSREALVETVIRGLGFSRAAASFRVTPKTAAKWFRRYQSEGVAGLRDRSSRPHRSPRATSSSQVGLVIELRRQHRPGGWATLTTKYSAGLSSSINRNNWGCAPSRAFREGACRTADAVRPRRVGVQSGSPRELPRLRGDLDGFPFHNKDA